MEHKILDAYNEDSSLNGLIQLGGLVALVIGGVYDSSAMSIAGGSGLVGGLMAEGIDYTKAYLEATLDYKANNKFTKVKE